MELAKTSCQTGNELNVRGGSEAAVTVRTRCGWIEFREYVESHLSDFLLIGDAV